MNKWDIIIELETGFFSKKENEYILCLIRFTVKRIWAAKKGRFHELENDPDRGDAWMALQRANIIPICSFIKGKGLFLFETSLSSYPLVEISGIEPLTS